MQKSTICVLGDAAVKMMDRLVPLSELTSTEDNYALTLIDGLTMETVITCYGGLISRAGSMVHAGNYVKITMPSDVGKIFTVHTNSCIPGVGKVRPAGQIRPASSVDPARGNL